MKIAVWGIGSHTLKNILPALKKVDGIDLYGVLSRDKVKAAYCQEKYNCLSWNNSDEMLSDNLLDAVYVCSPINLHSQQGLKILKSNKHFWAEKSFTCSADQTKKLIDISNKKQLTLAEGFMYFYHPQFLWLKDYLSSIKNSDINSINAKFTIPLLPNAEKNIAQSLKMEMVQYY